MVTFEPSLFFFLPRGGKHFLEEGEREKEDKTLQPFFSFRRNLCGQAFPPPPPPPPFSSEAKEIAATTLPFPLFHLHKNFFYLLAFMRNQVCVLRSGVLEARKERGSRGGE